MKRVESIVLGCCTLHNILCERNRTSITTQVNQEDTDNGALIAGSWRKGRAKKTLEDLKKIKCNTGSEVDKKQRQYLMLYFNSSAGRVAWQKRMIPRQKPDTSDEEEDSEYCVDVQ